MQTVLFVVSTFLILSTLNTFWVGSSSVWNHHLWQFESPQNTWDTQIGMTEVTQKLRRTHRPLEIFIVCYKPQAASPACRSHTYKPKIWCFNLEINLAKSFFLCLFLAYTPVLSFFPLSTFSLTTFPFPCWHDKVLWAETLYVVS